jgi:hypothetical protein
MLLQTNSYVVPKERRSEHARLMRRFRQVLGRLGCDEFEVYEQTGPNWSGAAEGSQRFVQIMRFRDRKHHAALQAAERADPAAQQLIAEFCEMVNFPYQQQHGFFAVGFYTSVLEALSLRGGHEGVTEELPPEGEAAALDTAAEGEAPPAERQAYAAEELAESHEPGHLAESEGPAEVGEDPVLAEEPLMSAEPSVDPEPPPQAEEPPAKKGRRRKKATG